jgi:queuosine precursor transporter
MSFIFKYKYSLLYCFAVVAVNAAFNYYPIFVRVGSGSFTLWAFVVGFWFVLRDFSQRELKHLVLLPMTLGVAFGVLINPTLALATAISSGTSELIDWGLYSFIKKPFHQRILISSLISCPVDSIMFFGAMQFLHVIPGVNVFNWASILAASASKLVAALVIFWMYQKKLNAVPVEGVRVA